MNEQVQKLVRNVTTFWEAQDKKRRILYISIAVAILLIAIIITIILNKKDYVVLYEGLENSEAAEMVTLIEEWGYNARMSNGTIMVLSGTENTIAMQLALQEYPKSNKNYTRTMNNTGMFTTESEFNTYYRLDTQDRLSAQIKSMVNISDAVVTLTSPEQINTVIPALRMDSTASVMVYLDGIEKLSNDQIIGIKHLVKTSWPGLTEDNISIVDGYGIPQFLTEEVNNDNFNFILNETRKLAYKTNLENSIKAKVLELLIPAYGSDGVSVAVNMVLDFDSKVSETVDYSPEGNTNAGVLQHADVDNATGGTTVQGGVVGVEYNADDTYPTGDTNGNDRWTEESFSNTYLVDTYKEQVEKDGYDIEGLSIAVVIYTDYLSEAQRQDLVRAVGNAGTVNPEVVEDVVTVTNLPKFSDADLDADTVPVYLFGLTFDQLILVGAIVLIILLILFIALAILSNNAKKKRREFEKQVLEAHSLELEGGEPVDVFTFGESGDVIEVPSLTDDQVETKEVVIRREISDFAKQSPEIVAQLLKTWIKEEDV